jgi:hypothetical protein
MKSDIILVYSLINIQIIIATIVSELLKVANCVNNMNLAWSMK